MSNPDQKSAGATNEQTIARFAAVLKTAVDAIITTDAVGTIEIFNQAAERMFGCTAEDVVGQNVSRLMPMHHASQHDRYIRHYNSTDKPRVIGRTRELSAKRFDGTEFPVELALSGANVNGKLFFTGIIRDITARREAESKLHEARSQLERLVSARTAALKAANDRLEQTTVELRRANTQLQKMARIDELTGIGNRRAFDERLDLEWRRQQRRKRSLALLMCDVDQFKKYNDHYGHPAGDECLRQIGQALRTCFQRADEFPARYGGEEFAVILSGSDPAEAAERAEALRQAILALDIEHEVGAAQVVTVSVGVATTVPDRESKFSELVVAADTALYAAKQNGRNRIEMTSI